MSAEIASVPQQTGWTCAIRIMRQMIEQNLSPSREKERLLSHMPSEKWPFPSPDAGAEALAIELHSTRKLMIALWRVVERIEPEFYDALEEDEKRRLPVRKRLREAQRRLRADV